MNPSSRFLCLIAAAVALLAGPVRAALPSAGLAGHWRFDTVTGDRIADRSPSGNALVLEQPAFHAELGATRSLDCDGFEVGGRLDERTPLQFAEGLTLAIWVYPVRARGHEPLSGRPNPTPSWTTPVTGLYLSDARPVFGLFGNGKKLLLEGPELPLRSWSLVTVTLDGRQATLWINGAKVAEAAQAFAVPPAGGQPWLFGRSQSQYFRGRLGETLLWSRALTSAEIAAVHTETAAGYPRSAAATPWHDRFVAVESPGTRATGTWRSRPTRTLAGLEGYTHPTPPPTDRWGGRTDRPALKASGFFRTEQLGDRWWLVTPEGHLYWNVGVNSVRGPRQTPPVAPEAFAVTATRELRELGFNGLGNGGSPALQTTPQALPWSVRLNFLASFAQANKQTYATSGHTGFTEQCIPVFHPDFPAWARKHAAALAATVDDPSVIGIFTDNELQCPIDLLDRHLRLSAEDPYLRHGRAAALAWLAARGRPADPAQLTQKDRCQFIAHVFATYTHLVHDAIRAVDTHHLILGPRFNEHRGQFENPWFWPAVGPWIDVAAVNYYVLWGPQTEDIRAWSAALQRPVMLTEWYSKAQDAPGLANTNGAGWLVRTQTDRARYYQHFSLAAFETPALVGFHYFKYMDDGSDSVALDSAGGANKGLYHADGTPWTELIEAARATNRAVYPLIDLFDARRKSTPAVAR
ncbi:MAG: LamG domain-containing protein [Verrucomicrobia bacterium]|nr:LamG domain-containing protein [Verrucomicrobiota bacterium]